MKRTKHISIRERAAAVMLIAVMIAALAPVSVSSPASVASAASITASGRINTSSVNLRKSASSSSKIVAVLKENTKLTIHTEVFTSRSSTAKTTRWYYVNTGKKSGYVRADLVKDIKYSSTTAYTTDALNYRKGPDTAFTRLGTVAEGTKIKLRLPARIAGSSSTWYRAKVAGKTAYVISDYVRIGKSLFIKKSKKELAGKSELAKALLSNPTSGGKARVVYTFSTKNCQKLFAVKGYKKAKVPQGFTFTGTEYYFVYGMVTGQSIVTYSASGERKGASKFAFSIGHPNGITYDPVTKKCYIFKGNQKTIYTWDPATGKYGRSKTPYSSSGVGYDKATNTIYASSHTGIRAYSADGSFTHLKLFSRCSHGIFHYIQDCGAGEGFIFHGISGAKKRKTNYLDIYRAEDNAYLGSIKITIGEYESAVVGNDGYLQLLINTDGCTDYVWKTPLNVRELK